MAPLRRNASAAEYREWIRAQLTHGEQLVLSRSFLGLPPTQWRLFDRAEGYAVVTTRRMFIVHANGAYEGRIHRPSYPHLPGMGRRSSLPQKSPERLHSKT